MNMLAPMHEQTAGAVAAPSAGDIYRNITAKTSILARAEPFTAHVLACALTVALSESCGKGAAISSALGLGRLSLDSLTAQWAPGAREFFSLENQPEAVSPDEEEAQLHELLTRFQSDDSPLCGWITAIVARRAMSPNHLWQDLGLLDRSELNRVMREWFPALAAANAQNMKWKKFFYRQLCELEGFSLCAAPTCQECDDFKSCFGEEDGETLLARLSGR